MQKYPQKEKKNAITQLDDQWFYKHEFLICHTKMSEGRKRTGHVTKILRSEFQGKYTVACITLAEIRTNKEGLPTKSAMQVLQALSPIFQFQQNSKQI